MIEEASLPKWISRVGGFNRSREDALQSSNPISDFNIMRQGDKKMDVIRKNHVPSDRNPEIGLRALRERNESPVKSIICQIRTTSIGAEGYEVKRASWKDYIQSSWRAGELGHGAF